MDFFTTLSILCLTSLWIGKNEIEEDILCEDARYIASRWCAKCDKYVRCMSGRIRVKFCLDMAYEKQLFTVADEMGWDDLAGRMSDNKSQVYFFERRGEEIVLRRYVLLMYITYYVSRTLQ